MVGFSQVSLSPAGREKGGPNPRAWALFCFFSCTVETSSSGAFDGTTWEDVSKSIPNPKVFGHCSMLLRGETKKSQVCSTSARGVGHETTQNSCPVGTCLGYFCPRDISGGVGLPMFFTFPLGLHRGGAERSSAEDGGGRQGLGGCWTTSG